MERERERASLGFSLRIVRRLDSSEAGQILDK